MKALATISGLIILGIILVLCFFTTTVDTGDVGIITHFGDITGVVLDPGWHLVGPIDHVTEMSTRTTNATSTSDCVSSDQQVITVQFAVQSHITKAEAPGLYSKYGLEYFKQAEPKLLDALKAITAKYQVSDIMVNRDKIRTEALDEMRSRLSGFIEVDDFSIADIQFGKEYQQAIEAKQVAQQRAEQAKYELQQAQVEADKAVATAKGEAEAIQIKGDALAKNPSVIQLELIHKWDGKAPDTLVSNGGAANGAGSIILPISTGSVK